MNPVEFTGQEQRITFQLYNYWFGLAADQGIPPLKSLTPEDIAVYKDNMVLIDLRDSESEPTLQVIGQLLKQDVEQDLTHAGVSEIPRRTLLSRITDHYMEVLANKSPISFDAEFNNKAKEKILYRGILLPFSDDGENINFILGAIRWISENELSDHKESEPIAIDPPAAQKKAVAKKTVTTKTIEENLPLLTSLDQCRRLIQGQGPTDLRSRKSLYQALGAVLTFHELCLANPAHYGALLQAEGLKAQARAPFTPVLKLCFGRDYDKTRLTEYAAALSFAQKNHQNGAGLPDFLDQFPGGIKGCVQAERTGRPVQQEPPIQEENKHVASEMPAIASFPLASALKNKTGHDDLCLILGRHDGLRMDVIKILKEDEKLLAQILNRLAKEGDVPLNKPKK